MKIKNLQSFAFLLKKFLSNNNIKIEVDNDGKFYFFPLEHTVHIGSEEISKLHNAYRMAHEVAHATSEVTGRNTFSNYALEEVIADYSAFLILEKLNIFLLKYHPESNVSFLDVMEQRLQNASYTSGWLECYLRANEEETVDSVFKKINEETTKIVDLIIKENN